MTDEQGPTIPEMVEMRDALHAGSEIGTEAAIRAHRVAVTAAEQLAKALADIMPRKLPNGSYGNGKYANAADLLDRLDPGWREREGE